jgi:hypothetical protein
MKQNLIAALVKCGFIEGETLVLQGTLAEDKPYPANFVTIWTDYTADNSHFDNNVTSVEWHFTVIFYTNNAEEITTKPIEIINTLRAAGFIPQGKGQDIPSDEQTHTGWAMEFIGVENL